MKKSRIIYRFLIVAAVIALFAACKQDVIFYDIAQEVEYEAPIVEGNVLSMVPCNGFLFVQNNNIYKKAWTAEKKPEARWRQLDVAPVSGKPVVMLASDSGYLYALVKGKAADETGDVYTVSVSAAGELGSWSSNPVAEDVKWLFDNRVFATDGTTSGRNAYYTASDNKVYKLAGSGSPADVSSTATDVLGSTKAYICAAGSDGTTDYFSSNAVFAVLNVSGTTYLYTFDRALDGSGKTLKYKASGATSWKDGGTTDSIMTVLTAYGNDKLLVGTMHGYETSTVGSDGKPSSGETPANNAESAFGTRYVTGIWHYGAEGTLYAAVVEAEHSQYNKLWGFYTSRKKWNYE